MKRFYVSGGITGCEGFLEKFARGCEEVRALGYEPVNPCDYIPEGWTYEQYLIRDLHELLDCDGIFALSDWHKSNGARIEVNLALSLGKPVIFQVEK